MTPQQYQQATFGPQAGSAGMTAASNSKGYGDWASSLDYGQQQQIGNILTNSANQAGPFGQGIDTSMGMTQQMIPQTAMPGQTSNMFAPQDLGGYGDLVSGNYSGGQGQTQESIYGMDAIQNPANLNTGTGIGEGNVLGDNGGFDWANTMSMASDVSNIAGGLYGMYNQYQGMELAKDQLGLQQQNYQDNKNRRDSFESNTAKAFG